MLESGRDVAALENDTIRYSGVSNVRSVPSSRWYNRGRAKFSCNSASEQLDTQIVNRQADMGQAGIRHSTVDWVVIM